MTTYPDDLGVNQTRTLDSANRSFESVVYQRKKPPLSCEVNLTSRLASDHAQDAFKALSPSGWTVVGSIRDTFTGARAGDLICSPTLASNTIELIGIGSLVAYVNGEKIQVQGCNSATENNLITLSAGPTSGTRADFVFLEVWRRLVSPTDTVYMNGNVQYGGTNPDNDLIDPAIDIETSLRVQVQYRIRVSDSDIQAFPEGFDPYLVFAQGPLDYPLTGTYYFSQMADDPGLWRAGNGDPGSQAQLGTVDGYVYAIPMFVIARRNSSTYNPITQPNGSGRTLADYLAGMPSDRPDNKYSDFIVADDILDLRHRINSSENAKDLCDKAFSMALRGDLRAKMSKNLYGEDHYGVTLVQPDGISPNNPGWFYQIATGDSIRRTFANAPVTQNLTLVQRTISEKDAGSSTGPWTSGDSISPPLGSYAVSVQDVYITKTTAPSFIKNFTIATGNDPFCVCFNFTSSDGTSWTSNSLTSGYYPKVTIAGDRVLGLFGAFDEMHELHESMDGANWSTLMTSIPALFDVAWNVDSIAVIGTAVVKSSFDNGVTWNDSSTAITAYRLIWGNNQYLGVGSGGSTITSPDGLVWTDHVATTSATTTFYDVIWNGSLYVGVGIDSGSGVVLTSPDGLVWTSQSVPALSGTILSIAKDSNLLAAVGETGYIITSPDGLSWTQRTSVVSGDFMSISWTGTFFVTISSTAEIVVSFDGITWNKTNELPTGIKWIASSNAAVIGNLAKITTSSLNNNTLTLTYTADYPAGQGFSQLPQEVLEFRAETVDSSSFASINSDITVRSSDTTDAYLSNRSGNITEYYDFGHQMLYHLKGNGLTQVSIPRNLYGYEILGIASLYDGSAYRSLTSITRDSIEYVVTSSTFTLNSDMTAGLYTSGKFFQTSIQGRGIIDTFEMDEFIPVEVASGQTTFHIDSTNKAMLKIASNQSLNGRGIAYVNGTQTTLLNSNANLPADTTASKITLEFSVAPAGGALIEVPVLMKSAVTATEGYVAYYKTLPYQGILTGETNGIIEAMGSAVITSAGSGGITNQVMDTTGLITTVADSTVITGTQTNWLSTAKIGYTIALDTTLSKQYKITDVLSDTAMYVSSPVSFSDTGAYTIYGGDLANFEQANIIDRMPALLNRNDSSGTSSYLSVPHPFPVLETSPTIKIQDIVGRDPIDLHIGMNGAERGRSTVHIDGASIGKGNLGLRYADTSNIGKYQKAYQSYILNKDRSGELYLMIVGSETDNTSMKKMLNEKSNNDVVDIYRIPGRPINLRKVD